MSETRDQLYFQIIQLKDHVAALQSQLALLQWRDTSRPPVKDMLIEVFNSGDTPSVSVYEYEAGSSIYGLGEFWREVTLPQPTSGEEAGK